MMTILLLIGGVLAGWATSAWLDDRRERREQEAARRRVERWREHGIDKEGPSR